MAGGLVALTGAAVFMIFYRAPQPVEIAQPKVPRTSVRSIVASRLKMVHDPVMVNIMLSGVILISVQYGVLMLSVPYLRDTAAISIGQAALVLFVAQMAGVAGRIILASWSDRCNFGRYIPVLVCMIAVAVGLVTLIVVPLRRVWVSGVLFAWLGFFGFGWYGPWVAYVAESATPEKTGFALGLAMAVNQIAVILAPPVLGLLKDTTHSYALGWIILAATTLLVLVVTSWRVRLSFRSVAQGPSYG